MILGFFLILFGGVFSSIGWDIIKNSDKFDND